MRVFGAVVVGTPAYMYYRSIRERHHQQTFSLMVREKGLDGKMERVEKTFPLISLKDAEKRIRENTSYEAHTRPSGLTWKHTTAFLASNDPIEDANSNQII
jgi:pyruvate dehydrogenase phosphatase